MNVFFYAVVSTQVLYTLIQIAPKYNGYSGDKPAAAIFRQILEKKQTNTLVNKKKKAIRGS